MAATLAAGLFFYSSCTPAEKTDTKDYTQYVNTFIGGADNGHTFPGACYPFGMIQTSPVTGTVLNMFMRILWFGDLHRHI